MLGAFVSLFQTKTKKRKKNDAYDYDYNKNVRKNKITLPLFLHNYFFYCYNKYLSIIQVLSFVTDEYYNMHHITSTYSCKKFIFFTFLLNKKKIFYHNIDNNIIFAYCSDVQLHYLSQFLHTNS